MKRPQGFDRPAAAQRARRAPETARSAGSAPRAGASGAGAASGGGAQPGAGAADRVTTEPIPVIAAAAPRHPEPARRPPAPADHSVTEVIEPLASRPETPAGPESPSAPESSAADAPRTPRAARRALAAATRERRRYERQEVRRFTKRSRRRRLAWVVGIGSVVALTAAVVGIAYSPLMALREVRVEGAQLVPAADVQAAFGGLMGTPLPLLDANEVHSAIAGFPLIETYSTETIPPGTLVVRIAERTPVGVIDTGSGLELVDAAGVVIDRPAQRPDGQPLITVDGGIAGEGFRAIARVVRSLPADVRAQLTAATAATTDDVRLELSGGASVMWGSAEDSALKAAVLAPLMRAAPPDTVSVYDVSAPTSPVTR